MLLERPEFFTEIRTTQVDDSEITEDVLTDFNPGDPNNPLVLAVGDISANTEPSSVFSPSFFAYVYPWEKFAAGISRVELNKNSNVTRNGFLLDFDPSSPGDEIPFLGTGRIETDLSVWNVSGAAAIGDTLSVGGTIAVGILNLKSFVSNSIIDDPNNPILIDPAFVTGPTEVGLYQTSINDTDTDVAFNVGVHWRPYSTLSFGAVYRGGMEFEVTEFLSQEAGLDSMFGFTLSDPSVLGSPMGMTFNTPDSYGAGVSWNPMSTLTFSLDWVHIEYEDLLEGFQSGMNVLTLSFIDPNFNLAPVATEPEDYEFTIEDADEIHFGVEYVFTNLPVPWAIRGGAYTDHNSRLFSKFEGDPFFSDNNSFPERDTETHVTVGSGVVVKGQFQVDVAADFSSIVNEYVLSTIFRF
jgi:long-subunit fatty acid transport protein